MFFIELLDPIHQYLQLVVFFEHSLIMFNLLSLQNVTNSTISKYQQQRMYIFAN